MTDIEKNILCLIRQSDEKAFELFFKMYFKKLCIYANHYVRDKEEAENIVKDSFVKIWGKRKDLPIDNSLIGYLYSTVRNHAINHLQRERKKNAFIQNASADFEKEYEAYLSDIREYPISDLIIEDLKLKITEIVDTLPPQCREIFILSRFEMLSHDEISQKTGITVATIKTQIVRALAKLRIGLAEYLSLFILLWV